VSCQPSSRGFQCVGGCEQAKRALKELVLMPLMYPQLYSSLGIQPPRCVFVCGEGGWCEARWGESGCMTANQEV
jgi:ATP-dependent 26S proteasome regulatory subunit